MNKYIYITNDLVYDRIQRLSERKGYNMVLCDEPIKFVDFMDLRKWVIITSTEGEITELRRNINDIIIEMIYDDYEDYCWKWEFTDIWNRDLDKRCSKSLRPLTDFLTAMEDCYAFLFKYMERQIAIYRENERALCSK